MQLDIHPQEMMDTQWVAIREQLLRQILKDIGVTFDSLLNFETHIRKTITMGIIRRTFEYLDAFFLPF